MFWRRPRRSWAFALFVVNRYTTILGRVTHLVYLFWPPALSSNFSVCTTFVLRIVADFDMRPMLTVVSLLIMIHFCQSSQRYCIRCGFLLLAVQIAMTVVQIITVGVSLIIFLLLPIITAESDHVSPRSRSLCKKLACPDFSFVGNTWFDHIFNGACISDLFTVQ